MVSACTKSLPKFGARDRKEFVLIFFVSLSICTAMFTSGQTWSYMGPLSAPDLDANDQYGISMAITETHAIVGANNKENPDGTLITGAAYIFERANGNWVGGRMQFPTLDAGERVGTSVGLSTSFAIVGSPGKYINSGSAYVFPCLNLQCTGQELPFPPITGDDEAGRSVAITDTFAAVGSPFTFTNLRFDAGAVYLFTYSQGSWSHQKTMTPPNISDFMFYGAALAMDAQYLIVGAPEAVSTDGRAYVYTFGSGSYNFAKTLTAVGEPYSMRFGSHIGIHRNTLYISSTASKNMIYVYSNPPTWSGTATTGVLYPFSSTMLYRVIGEPSFSSSMGRAYVELNTQVSQDSPTPLKTNPQEFTQSKNPPTRSHTFSQKQSKSKSHSFSDTASVSQSKSFSRTASFSQTYSSSPKQSKSESRSASKTMSPIQTKSMTQTISSTTSVTQTLSHSLMPQTQSRLQSRSYSHSQYLISRSPKDCDIMGPHHIYVACSIPKTLTPLVQTKKYKDAIEELMRLSDLLNQEIGSSQDIPGKQSRIESRKSMSQYLYTISSNPDAAVSSQKPTLEMMAQASRSLYRETSGLTSSTLFEGCESIFKLSSLSVQPGIQTQTGEDLIGATDMIGLELNVLGIKANGVSSPCNIPEIQKMISAGLLTGSGGNETKVSGETTIIYSAKGAAVNMSRVVVMGETLSVGIKASDFLQSLADSYLIVRIASSMVNIHGNSGEEANGTIASQVVTVEFLDTNGDAMSVSTNETIADIVFTGNSTIVPSPEKQDVSPIFVYQGNFNSKLCVTRRPVCATWDERNQKWIKDGLTYAWEADTAPDEYLVTCSTTHLSEFSIFMEPIKPIDDCEDGWVKDHFFIFLGFTVIYGFVLSYISWQVMIILKIKLTQRSSSNPSAFIIHSCAAALALCRLVYFNLALTGGIEDASKTSLLVLVSLPFYFLFILYTLMAFLWYDALKSKSTKTGFLAKSKPQFFASIGIVAANLITIWVLASNSSDESFGSIATYGSLSLAVISSGLAVGFFWFGRKLILVLQEVSSHRASLMVKIYRLQASCTLFFVFNACAMIFNSFKHDLLYDHFGAMYSIYLILELGSLGNMLYCMRVVSPRTHQRLTDSSTNSSYVDPI